MQRIIMASRKNLITFYVLFVAIFLNAEISIYDSDLSGSWYSSDSEKLKAEIAQISIQSEAKTSTGAKIEALILPHAGYIYSGKTAQKALRYLNQDYDTIIILGASHRMSLKRRISIPLFDFYSTPLGKVGLNREKAEKLLTSSIIFENNINALRNEHSVQIQIPLLQFNKIIGEEEKIIFLIAGELSPNEMKEAAKKIRKLMDDKTLLIVSSDFTHYGERFGYVPFEDDLSKKIKDLDMTAFSFIQKKDSHAFLDFVKKNSCTICGTVPLAILAFLAENDNEIKLIDYSDSSKVNGIKNDRVSYISAIMEKRNNKNEEKNMLTDAEKKTLLKIARATIKSYFEDKNSSDLKNLESELTENLKQKRAAFVTLTINSELRGCIGHVLPIEPLYKSVISNAINAAFSDPRFSPLRKDELSKIHIEISALTIPEKIKSYEDIVLGRDGIILKKGHNSALFLPQVATEQGWNLEETLSHLAYKAGLSPNAWEEGCEFQTFQAEVFGE